MTTPLMTPPPPPGTEITSADLEAWRNQIWGAFSGKRDWARRLDLTAIDDDTYAAVALQNEGSGGALDVYGSDDVIRLRVNDTGVILSSLLVTGNMTVGGTLGVTGHTTLTTLSTSGLATLNSAAVTTSLTVGTTLGVTGTSTLGAVNAGATSTTTLASSGLATLNSLSVTNNATVGGTLGVTGVATLSNNAIVGGTLSVTGATALTALLATGNVILGDADTDTHRVVGVTTFRNAAASATQLFVDAGNNRVIVGSGTAMTSDTTPNLQVVGRLYVGPDSANDLAVQIRRSAAATVGWSVGVTSAADLVFKDDADGERFRVGDASSTYQALVTGALGVTAGAAITGSLSAAGLIAGASSFAGSEELRVVGQTRLEGATEVTTGGLTVTAGGLVVSAGGAAITGNSSVTGTLVSSGTITANNGLVAAVSGILITSGGFTVSLGGANITGGLTVATGGITVSTTGVTLPSVDPPTANGLATAASLIKAFAFVTGGGGATLGDNYNIASVTRNGAGDFTVAWDRDFSGTGYSVVATLFDNGADLDVRVNGKAAGSADIHFRAAGVLTDPDGFSVWAAGTLS